MTCAICRLIGRHVGPVVVRAGAADGVVGVERGEVERRDVQEHKVPAAGGVDRVESRVDAIGVVSQGFTRSLRVGEEGIGANVVGTCALVPSVEAGEAWNKV
jgi:hypothetical protein